MILDDPLGLEADGDICTVCGKRLRDGDALSHIQQDGETISICCPLCMETFQREPGRFSAKCRARRLMRGEGA